MDQVDRAAHALAQWRNERPDLDASSMVVMGRLQEAALVIARDRLNPLFARYGMQPGEFDVLATLRRGGAPFALTPTALYDALMMSSGGMTARIDRLQKAGWVERRPNPADGRGTLVALTDAGRALIDEAVVAHIDNQRQLLAVLSDDEQAQLSRLLEKLLAGVGAGRRESWEARSVAECVTQMRAAGKSTVLREFSWMSLGDPKRTFRPTTARWHFVGATDIYSCRAVLPRLRFTHAMLAQKSACHTILPPKSRKLPC